MVALMAMDDTTGYVVPVDVRHKMSDLLLLGQLCEAQGLQWYYQLGVVPEMAYEESPESPKI